MGNKKIIVKVINASDFFFVFTFDLILKITKWNLQPHLQDTNELNEIGFRTCTALPH